MSCRKCHEYPCVCEEQKDDDNSTGFWTNCLQCGGRGFERDISKNDFYDPQTYIGPCRACGGKGYN
jgi:hypothetical protein